MVLLFLVMLILCSGGGADDNHGGPGGGLVGSNGGGTAGGRGGSQTGSGGTEGLHALGGDDGAYGLPGSQYIGGDNPKCGIESSRSRRKRVGTCKPLHMRCGCRVGAASVDCALDVVVYVMMLCMFCSGEVGLEDELRRVMTAVVGVGRLLWTNWT